jgi:hypothetical protein
LALGDGTSLSLAAVRIADTKKAGLDEPGLEEKENEER